MYALAALKRIFARNSIVFDESPIKKVRRNIEMKIYSVLLCTAVLACASGTASWYDRFLHRRNEDEASQSNAVDSYLKMIPKIDGNYKYQWIGSNYASKNGGGKGGYYDEHGGRAGEGDWMPELMDMMGGASSGGDKDGNWIPKMMQMLLGKKDGDEGDWLSNMTQSFTGGLPANGMNLTRWGMRTVPKIPGEYAYTWRGNNYDAYAKSGKIPAVFWRMVANNIIRYEWGEYKPGRNKYDLPPPLYWKMYTTGAIPYEWNKALTGGGFQGKLGAMMDWFRNAFIPTTMSGEWDWRGDFDTEPYDFTGLNEEEAWIKWFTDMMTPRTMEGGWVWASTGDHGFGGYDDGKGMMKEIFKYVMDQQGGY